MIGYFAVLVAMSGLSDANERAAVRVEGNREALAALLDVQQANLSGFHRGRMIVKATDKGTNESIQAEVVWNSRSIYWKFVADESAGENHRGQAIETESLLITTYPEHGSVYVYPGKSRSPSKIFRLRPDDIWFKASTPLYNYGVDAYRWTELLDPTKVRGRLSHFTVRQVGEQVEVVRHYSTGGLLRITASFAHGGNVVSYEDQPGDGAISRSEGRYDWERLPNGTYYLRRYEAREYAIQAGGASSDGLMSDYTYEVAEFDPNPTIKPNRFTLESLKLPKGTLVREESRTRRRNYYIGGKPDGIPVDTLLELGKSLRSDGFASPDRAQ